MPPEVHLHHIFSFFQKKIRFVLFRFRSLLLTESQLISFPPDTKMFQFSGYTFLSELLQFMQYRFELGDLQF